MSPELGAPADASGEASALGTTDVANLHLHRYQAYMRTGESRAALRAASDACHVAPLRPEPHYAYGEAWLAVGEPHRAAQAFAAAVRLKTDWPEGQPDEAVRHAREMAAALGGGLNAVIGGSGNTTVAGAPGGYTVVTLGNGNDTVHSARRHSAPEPGVSCRDDQPRRLALHGDGDHHEPA